MPVDASLVSFFFASPNIGWVVLQKYPPDVLDYQANEYWIMQTPDAGEKWNTQYNGHQGQVDKLTVASNQEGWATGRRFIKTDTLQSFPFVIHTTDQGTHWSNVSENLTSVLPGDEVTDLYTPKESVAMLTTTGGKVFKTENAGQSWQDVAALEGEPTQTYFGRLGQTQAGRLWLLGGSDSLEGMWGVLAKRALDGSWTRYTASAYFRDAVFLSEEDVLVCGHIRKSDGSAPLQGHSEGVILRSLDGGNSWTTIYRTSQVTNINALAAINSTTIWAVGDKGFVLQVTFPAEPRSAGRLSSIR
jgi:hypothetical protein